MIIDCRAENAKPMPQRLFSTSKNNEEGFIYVN